MSIANLLWIKILFMISLPELFLPKLRHFGLSIGRTSLRGVEVDQKGKVRGLAEVELPDGVLESGVLVKKEVIVDALKKLQELGHFTTPYVAVCFSEVYAYGREYRLPVISKEDLGEAVSWHIQELIPFPQEEIYFDWRLIETTDTDFKVSVVAVPKNILDPLIEVLGVVGLKPLSFEPGASAIAKLLVLKADESVLITQINRKGAYVTLVQKGKALFTTVVNITDEDTPATYLENIVDTIKEVTEYYKTKGDIRDESTFVLLTGELASDDWAKAVGEKSARLTRLLKTPQVTPAFNKAYAAAVAKISPPADEQSINLLPARLQHYYGEERYRQFYQALVSRVLFLVGLLLVFSVGSFISVSLARGKLEGRVAALTQENKTNGTNSQGLLMLSANAKNIVTLAPLRVTVRDKLAVIASILPDGITVTQWEYDDSKLQFTLTGMAKDRSELLIFKNKLETTGEFAKITLPLGSLETAQNVRFSLTFIIKK